MENKITITIQERGDGLMDCGIDSSYSIVDIANILQRIRIGLLEKYKDEFSLNTEIGELTDEQEFHIVLIADLLEKLANERIITPSQRGEIKNYILQKISKK